jgi:hypothetical protein
MTKKTVKKASKKIAAGDGKVSITVTITEQDIVNYFNNPEKLPNLTVLHEFFGEHLKRLAERAASGSKKKVSPPAG